MPFGSDTHGQQEQLISEDGTTVLAWRGRRLYVRTLIPRLGLSLQSLIGNDTTVAAISQFDYCFTIDVSVYN